MLNSSGYSTRHPTAKSLQQAANQVIDLEKYIQATDTVTSVLTEVYSTLRFMAMYCMNPRSCYCLTTTYTYRPASLLSNNLSGAFPF